GAGQDHQVAGDGVEGPDLVDAGHGDHRPVQHVRPAQVPRGGQVEGAGVAFAAGQFAALHPLPAAAGDRGHLGGGARAQQAVLPDLDPPQQVAGGVGYQEVVADLGGDVLRQGQVLVGLGELGGLVVPVGVAAPAGADHLVDGGAIGLEDDQPVLSGARDDQ